MLSLVTVLAVSAPAQAAGSHHRHHHHGGSGSTSGSGTGSGTGSPPPSIVVTASPNPLVETGPSLVMTVVQVEANPAFAGDMVNVSSQQLGNACELVYFVAFRGNGDNVNLTLDNDGNATVIMVGEDCAPGSDVIEADLMVAPFDTATTTLDVEPPVVTPAGVTGTPNPEVEVGTDDAVGNNDIGNSDVFAVFYVETDSVYAEQNVEISSAQLEASCLGGWVWISPNPTGSSLSGTGVITTGLYPQAQIDNDGNAVFGFWGRECAAGTSQVIADVEAGTNPTYVTSYTVEAPAPTV
jgi:hypothetical protein